MLIDFGLSKQSMDSIIQMGTYCGTPCYMAPEIFKGDYKEKIDVYALAVILH